MPKNWLAAFSLVRKIDKKMTHKSTREWRRLLAFLRETYPISRPVVVSRRPIKKEFGNGHFNGRVFKVYIDITQSEDEQKHSLLHEWAHVRAIDDAYQHKGQWGVIYGDIYQTWENWDNNLED
jgi:hypothetical protein